MIRLMFVISFAFALGAAVTTNAVLMLFAPRAWHRLPGWFWLGGRLSEKCLGSLWGNIQIRLFGAILLAVIAWVVQATFSRSQ